MILHGAGSAESGSRLWYVAVDAVAATPYRDFVIGKILSNGNAADTNGIYISHSGDAESTIGIGVTQPVTVGNSARLKVMGIGSMGALFIPYNPAAGGQTGDPLYIQKAAGLAFSVAYNGDTTVRGNFKVQTGVPTDVFSLDLTASGRITAQVLNFSVGPGATTSETNNFGLRATSTANAAFYIGTASWGALSILVQGVNPGLVSIQSSSTVPVALGANNILAMRITTAGDVIFGKGALTAPAEMATNATAGFAHMPCTNGPPTGVPSTVTGAVPWCYDRVNHKINIYDGGWKATAALA
jgi:hypothetical protein